MTVNQTFVEGLDLSYGDMERMGFNAQFIEDYQSLKRNFAPLTGTVANPNNNLTANLSGWYIDTSGPALWFNGSAGSRTGWVQLI